MNITRPDQSSGDGDEVHIENRGPWRSQLEPVRQFISNPTIAGRRLENHQSIRRNKNKCDYWLLRGSSTKQLSGLNYYLDRKLVLALTEGRRGDAANRDYLDVSCIENSGLILDWPVDQVFLWSNQHS